MIVLSVISSSRSAAGTPHFGKQARYVLRKSWVEQVARGQVDRDLQVESRVAPLASLSERDVQHVAAQGPDQPRALGHRDELDRRDQAARRVLPANKRLRPYHLAAFEIDLGLVVEKHLVRFECLSKLADHREPNGVVGVVLDRIDLVPAVRALGFVHRDVGVLEQHVDVLTVLRVEGDADACVDVDG